MGKYMDEIWLNIMGYEGQYQVSNTGYVRSIKRNRILKPTNINGYLQISLSNQGKIKKCLIHRLVAEAFLPNPNNLSQVNHKDENTFNNNVNNLEWCNVTYNNNYGTRNDRISSSHRDLNKSIDSKKVLQNYKFTYYKMQNIMTDIKNHIQQIISEANISESDTNNLWNLYKDIKSIASSYVQTSSYKEKNKTVPEIIITQQND